MRIMRRITVGVAALGLVLSGSAAAAQAAPEQAPAVAPAKAAKKANPHFPVMSDAERRKLEAYESEMRASGEEARVLAAAADADKKPVAAPKGMPRNPSGKTAGAGGSALAPCLPHCYNYNGFYQDFSADPATNTSVETMIGKPYVHDITLPRAHSLAEVSVQSSDVLDAVELGWIVDKGRRADGNPTLWAGHWINGSFKGYDTAFVDYAPNPINLGAGLPKPVVKQFGVHQTATAFWVYYDNVAVAYVPKSRWTPGGVVRPFNASVADFYYVKWFNEIANTETQPCDDMGTGTLWNASGTPTPPITTWDNYLAASPTIAENWVATWGGPTTPGIWGTVATTGDSGVTGGPGYDSTSTNVGTTGAC